MARGVARVGMSLQEFSARVVPALARSHGMSLQEFTVWTGVVGEPLQPSVSHQLTVAVESSPPHR